MKGNKNSAINHKYTHLFYLLSKMIIKISLEYLLFLINFSVLCILKEKIQYSVSKNSAIGSKCYFIDIFVKKRHFLRFSQNIKDRLVGF